MNSLAPDYVEVMPERSLEVLSQREVNRLAGEAAGGYNEVLRRCSLAVLNVGSATDDTREVLARYQSFRVSVIQQEHGIKLALSNAPEAAFVDGQMIRGIRELLFAVLRDVVFIGTELQESGRHDLSSSDGITNAVFHILRNAGILRSPADPDMVVCWGGHAIGRQEYEFTKEVGYELGLRHLNVCTGCGGGAMKGPMKGATIGHAKQRNTNGRYLGVTEPGIIAAESPNPIVNELVIMPDMEKRLEAFVRLAHGIVIFPGGVGTAEEILFLLGVLLHPDNLEQPYPLLLAGPPASKEYLELVDGFIRSTLGESACSRYDIVVGEPKHVAQRVTEGIQDVRVYRSEIKDAFFYNWHLKIEPDFQQPFHATHENMSALTISRDLPVHELAANLRRAFSGMVAGNIREDGALAIEEHGPFEIRGDRDIIDHLDELLAAFVSQGRMKLAAGGYEPCYRLLR